MGGILDLLQSDIGKTLINGTMDMQIKITERVKRHFCIFLFDC